MKKTTLTMHSYTHLKKAIAAEFLAGAERVRRSYREEVVRTSWNIGKILRGTLGLSERPQARNAALVKLLEKDFDKHHAYFYDVAKFHRLYPSKPPVDLSLSHYFHLIRMKDPQKRLALENKAITESMSSKDLRIFTHRDLGQVPALGKGSVLSVERGRLYHYRAANAPQGGHVLIDIGFGIERDIRAGKANKFHSAFIALAVKTGEDYAVRMSVFEKSRLYTYAATLKRVIDADTIIARVDLGFRTWVTQTLRLRGIDAPEVTSALGRKIKAVVRSRLEPCARLVIKTYKQEKFGRFLADVFYQKAAGDDVSRIAKEGTFLNQELLDTGLAVPYDDED